MGKIIETTITDFTGGITTEARIKDTRKARALKHFNILSSEDKLIPYSSCVRIFQANLQRSFATVSPVSIISGPQIPVLYSWAGSVSYTSLPSIAFGTIDRWRYDFNDSLPLNRDQWVLWSTGTAGLVRVKETEKSEIPNHRSDSLPVDIQNDSPKGVEAFTDDVIKVK